MIRCPFLATACVFAVMLSWANRVATAESAFPVPTAEQIAQIAGWLPAKPAGVGASVEDRKAWAVVSTHPAFQRQLEYARQYAGEPPPDLPNELFYEYKKTGRRDTYEKPFRQRTKRLIAFTIAECLSDDGVWAPLAEAEIVAILSERTWCVPASVFDSSLGGFDAAVDLAAAARAWNLATADYLLGQKLSAGTREAIRRELRRRVLDRYAASVHSGKPAWWWMKNTNNWNAVCTSGIVGAALATIESREERAFFVQAALNSIRYYTDVIPPDGYFPEGISYWMYGFGSYLCLAEALYQATQGRLNLYAGAKLREAALFLPHLQIVPGVLPAFGDAHPKTKKLPGSLMKLINHRWKMGWPAVEPRDEDLFAGHPLGDRLFGFGIFGFPWPNYRRPASFCGLLFPSLGEVAGGSPAKGSGIEVESRFFFPSASVLVCRAIQPGRTPFGLALKGGRNGAPHSHIDNGSYVVAWGDVPLIADPGMEEYTANSFGPRRFESMMMNSYGHSVPYVGRTLQKGGPGSEGKIIETEFTADRDMLKMDLTTGYPVPGMVRLLRTFIFHRAQPSVEIIDEAEFSSPTEYGSAVVTLSQWREHGPGSFLIYEKNLALAVTVSVQSPNSEAGMENKVEPITGFRLNENTKPMRLGVNVNQPVLRLVLRTLIQPVEMANVTQ